MKSMILLLMMLACSPTWAWTQANSKVVQADKISGVETKADYLKQGDAEILISGITQYADAAGVAPVDCTGGVGAVTMVRSNTAPLFDKWSWVITKPSGNYQGHGTSIDFTINNGDKRTAMQFVTEYLVNSGTFVHGTSSDLRLYIYDVTNATMLSMANNTMPHASTTDSKPVAQASFNTTTSTSYRACFHVATTSASAWSLKAESFVSKLTLLTGSMAFGWTAYTGTIVSTTGTLPAHTVNLMEYRRDADGKMWMRGKFTFTGTGTWANIEIPFPSGLTNATTNLDGTGTDKIRFNDVTNTSYMGQAYQQINKLVLYSENVGGSSNRLQTLSQTTPFTWASGDIVSWEVGPISIVGWGLSQPAVTAANWNFETRNSTPTWGNLGFTPGINKISYTRKGDRLFVEGLVVFASGTGSGSTLSLTIPEGLSIDTTKLGTNSGLQTFGSWSWYDDVGSSGTLDDNWGPVNYAGPTSVTFRIPNTSNPFTTSVMAANDSLSFNFNVPIVGWSETWNALQLAQTVYADTVVKAEKSTGLTSVDYGTASVAVSNGTNSTSITTPATCNYLRVGSTVTGTCSVSSGCSTAGTLSSLVVVPPVATTNGASIRGTIGTINGTENGRVVASGNNFAVQHTCGTTGAIFRPFSFTYQTQ